MTEIEQAKIIELVLRELERTPNGKTRKPKILAVFCGGLIGLEESVEGLKKLVQEGAIIDCVMTKAAELIIGADKIRSFAFEGEIFSDSDLNDAKKIVENADILTIPLLTFNTAAKIANGISDNLATFSVMLALLMGKPVIASTDACNLSHGMRLNMGHTKAKSYYSSILRDNVDKLGETGIALTNSAKLPSLVESYMGDAIEKSEPCECRRVFERRILSLADLEGLTGDTLFVGKNTLLTPSARDKANEMKIRVIVNSD
jgi:hypothetical protein